MNKQVVVELTDRGSNLRYLIMSSILFTSKMLSSQSASAYCVQTHSSLAASARSARTRSLRKVAGGKPAVTDVNVVIDCSKWEI